LHILLKIKFAAQFRFSAIFIHNRLNLRKQTNAFCQVLHKRTKHLVEIQTG